MDNINYSAICYCNLTNLLLKFKKINFNHVINNHHINLVGWMVEDILINAWGMERISRSSQELCMEGLVLWLDEDNCHYCFVWFCSWLRGIEVTARPAAVIYRVISTCDFVIIICFDFNFCAAGHAQIKKESWYTFLSTLFFTECIIFCFYLMMYSLP